MSKGNVHTRISVGWYDDHPGQRAKENQYYIETSLKQLNLRSTALPKMIRTSGYSRRLLQKETKYEPSL